MDTTAFAELRSFLHSETPSYQTRRQLFKMLQQAHKNDKKSYLDEWFPYLQGFDRWMCQPLCDVYVQGMSDGSIWNNMNINAEHMYDYRLIIPSGPLSLTIGGDQYHDDVPRADLDAKEIEQLRGDIFRLCIDEPMWSWDDGQNGYGEGHANMHSVLEGVLISFGELLNTVKSLKLKTASKTLFDVTLPSYEEQPSHPGQIGKLKNLTSVIKLIKMIDALESLELSIGFTSKKLQKLTKLAIWPTLQSLDLSQNNIKYDGVDILFSQPMSLTTLDLSYNKKFQDEGAIALSKNKSLQTLEVLNLTHCKVTQKGENALRKSSHLPNLTTIWR